MKNNIYMPYNFDFKFQYITYKNIGKRHEIKFKLKKRRYRIYEAIRNWYNKDERRYKNFDKFSQWRNYVKEEYKCIYRNYDDFMHYLHIRKDFHEFMCNVLGAIVVPIYICMITIMLSVYIAAAINPIQIIVILLVYILLVLIVSILLCLQEKNKYNFYRDLIEVLSTK